MNHNTQPNSLHPLRRWIPLAAILLALAPTQLHAGAWTQAPGGMYFKIAGLSFRSQDYLDAVGDQRERVAKPSMEELSDESISAYLEYGLLERLTLVATLPYKRLVYKNTEVKVFKSDLLDTTITRIHPDEINSGSSRFRTAPALALAPQSSGSLPSARRQIPRGLRHGSRQHWLPQRGWAWLGAESSGWRHRCRQQDPLGHGRERHRHAPVGRQVAVPTPGYLTSTVGYRKRGGAFSDEFFYGFEAGVTYKRLLVKGVVEGMRTTGDCGAMGQGGLVGDQDILKLAPGLIWSLSKHLELGVDLFHIAAGCNTAAGTTYAAGLAFKR